MPTSFKITLGRRLQGRVFRLLLPFLPLVFLNTNLTFAEVPKTSSPDTTCADALLRAVVDADFTIQADVLKLDPVRFRVRFQDKTITLPPMHYEVLESLLLADTPLDEAEFGEIWDRFRAEYDRAPVADAQAYKIQFFKRLRDRLADLSPLLPARIIAKKSMGYMWVDDFPVEKIQAGKLSRHPSKPIFYYQGRHLDLSPQNTHLLLALAQGQCRGTSGDYISAFLEKNGIAPFPTYFALHVAISRLNAAVQKVSGRKDLYLVTGERGMDFFRLSPELMADCPRR